VTATRRHILSTAIHGGTCPVAVVPYRVAPTDIDRLMNAPGIT
jgi:hypothetical protein